MEKSIIPKATLKQIRHFKPTIENWFDEDDYELFLLKIRIKPWTLSDEIINEFIEAEIVFEEYEKRRRRNSGFNLSGFAFYYFNTCLIIIKDYYSFERLKRIFERFISIQKECLKNERSRSELIEDISKTDAEDFKVFEKFSKLIREKCSKKEIEILENMIDKNYDIFLEYEYCNYRIKTQISDMYFNKFIQIYFPFSSEFIKKHYEYFLIDLVLENPAVKDNFDMQKFVFKNVLCSNLQKHLAYYTHNSENRDFIIDDDMVDGLVLKYNLK